MKHHGPDEMRWGGTIGDMSARIGYDVRDLIIAGYSWQQIHEVLSGHTTLAELFKCKPENESIDTKGS